MKKLILLWILLFVIPLVNAESVTIGPIYMEDDTTTFLNIGNGINPEVRWTGISNIENPRSMHRYSHSRLISLYQPGEATVTIPGPYNPSSLGATSWFITVYARIYSIGEEGCITSHANISNGNEDVNIPDIEACGNYGFTETPIIFETNDPRFLKKNFTFTLESKDSNVIKVEIFADTWYSTTSNIHTPSRNPSVIINGIRNTYYGNLSTNSKSPFQPLNGIQQNTNNFLRFNVSGSGKVMYEIRYEIPEAPPVPEPPVNLPPVANAGIDQTVNDSDNNGFEIITLNASGSTDADGLIVSYEWREGSIVLGTNRVLNYNFPIGLHTVTLTVTDNNNAIDVDTLEINIIEQFTLPPRTIISVIGTGAWGYSGDEGLAINAELRGAFGMDFDSFDNLFFADRENGRVRKVDTSGIITTVASGFILPVGIAIDNSGNLFVSDREAANVIKIDINGIRTIYVTGLNLNRGLAIDIDSTGNLYIADSRNHQIKKVDTNRVVTVVAGTGSGGFSGDGGLATQAQLLYPREVEVDTHGNIYIADEDNNRVRKVDTNGIITTVAGSGSTGHLQGGYNGDGGLATQALLNGPSDVVADVNGNIYIADNLNHRVRKVDPSGIITTIVGTGIQGFSGDNGPAIQAQLRNPHNLAISPTGDLYISDMGNNVIRKVVNLV